MTNDPGKQFASFEDGPPPWPINDQKVRKALFDAFEDGSWGKYQGHNCSELVEQLCQFHNTKFAKLTSSGTIAIEVALRAVGVSAGDEVILAAYDFSGNFRSIERIGAIPVLVDIDPNTWSFSAEHLVYAFSEKTKAIVVSHLHGGIAPMSELKELCQQRGVAIVEDACQATGARLKEGVAGSIGDIGVISFGGSKLLTAGRGGAILTSNEHWIQRIRIDCDQGNDAYALSELQAAVLKPQLEKLDQQNNVRAKNASRLIRSVNRPEFRPVTLPEKDCQASYYKIAWLIDPEKLKVTRDELIRSVQQRGIALDIGFRGFTKRSSRRCRKPHSLSHSELASANTVLLHHPILLKDAEQIEKVVEVIKDVIDMD